MAGYFFAALGLSIALFGAAVIVWDVRRYRRRQKSVSRFCLEHPWFTAMLIGAVMWLLGGLCGHLLVPQYVEVPPPRGEPCGCRPSGRCDCCPCPAP